MSGKLDPKQLAQAGASEAQVLAWKQSNNKWEPKTLSATAFQRKAGKVLNAAFTGTPKKATVTFATAYADGEYAVSFSEVNNVAGDSHNITIENQVAAGFTINLGANNIPDLIKINWQTSLYGEE